MKEKKETITSEARSGVRRAFFLVSDFWKDLEHPTT